MKISGKDILFVGHDLSDKGGISTLENLYEDLFDEYKHIAIYKFGGLILKLFIFFKGVYLIILNLIKNSQIRIVHIHTASGLDFYRNSIPLFIASAFKKQVVLHVHGGYFPVFYTKCPKINRFIIKRTNCIITVSEFLKNNMTQFDLGIPIYNVYNIVEKAKSKYVYVRNISDRIRLGFLGAINENKRIFDVVELLAKHPDLKSISNLTIAGVGDVSRLKKLIATNSLEDTVNYIGWIGKEEKVSFFNNIDLLLQPSDFESFGLSIAEAMSYGCPAIATNVGGIPEIIESGVNGLLIDVGDFESLYRHIQDIYINKESLPLMSKSAIRSVEKFSKSDVAGQLKHVYYELLK